MSASDVMSLIRDKVDITSTLDFDVSLSFARPASGGNSTRTNLMTPTCCGNSLMTPSQDQLNAVAPLSTSPVAQPFSVNVGVSGDRSTTERSTTRDEATVANKITRSSVVSATMTHSKI